MLPEFVVTRKGAVLGLLVLGILACNLQTAPPTETVPPPILPTGTSTIAAPTTPSPSFTSTVSSPTLSAPATASPTSGPPPLVVISASGGRLNVRRGPGPEYDTVGAFLDGQSATAIARNEDGGWVLINAPNTSTTLGWITLKTKFTTVSGTVSALPLMTVPPANPAYIRNCTPHEMLVNPGGAILMDRNNVPDNKLQFNPGEYTVIDQTTEDSVAEVTVTEGRTVDIKKDSSGSSYSCP